MRRSVPPVRPIRMLVQSVVQLRAYSSTYSSSSSRSTSRALRSAAGSSRKRSQFVDRGHAAQHVEKHAAAPFAVGGAGEGTR